MAKIVQTSPAKLTAEFKYKQGRFHLNTAESVQSPHPDWALEVIRGGEKYKTAVFHKTMPHNAFGEVLAADFDRMVRAMDTGEQIDFDAIPTHLSSTRKFVDPQAALSFVLAGQDNQSCQLAPHPSMSSGEAAAEMMEVYEMAMHRGMSFDAISGGGPTVSRAVNTLNTYGADFKGPKDTGSVTPKTLFRGSGQDETVGPFVSQMLVLPFDYGNIPVEQLIREELDQTNSTDVPGWLDIQNGIQNGPPNFSGNLRYAYAPRILASYVHNDAAFQPYYNAAQVLLGNGAPLDPSMPTLLNEEGFVCFGVADIFTSIAYVCKLALQAAWHHKWVVNLRLRPEVMAGRIHFQDLGEVYGIDPSGFGTPTIAAMKAYNLSAFGNNTALLPLVYPEGSPTHPEYPAGHAVVAGACSTVLKAWFDTTKTWTGDLGLTPKHSTNGTTLVDYTDGDASSMTVLGEINKVASNIALGRNMAGVHYRSAGDKGIALGEKIAIAFLKDLKECCNQSFAGWNLTKLDGSNIVI